MNLLEVKYGQRELYDSNSLIAIGDIHGEDLKLENLLEQVTPILDSNPKCHIVFCGDYCNRGSNSARVFEILINLKKKYPNQAYFIMGNHEEMFITTLRGKSTWMQFTTSTWDSMNKYWNKPMLSIQELCLECLNRGVVDFLDNLIPYYESSSFICTHAPLDKATCYMHGLREYVNDFGKETIHKYFLERILYNIRWDFTSEDPKLCKIPEISKYLICGHQFRHHKQPRLFKHRAFVDVGCGCKKETPLVAVKFPEKKVYRSF